MCNSVIAWLDILQNLTILSLFMHLFMEIYLKFWKSIY